MILRNLVREARKRARLVHAAGFELRVGLAEPDPEIRSLFSETLRKTPAERRRNV